MGGARRGYDTFKMGLSYSRVPERPRMTKEGIIWEDINHFVDYLTCRDLGLAYALNEMLLYDPQQILHQFSTLSSLMGRPICNHEVLGRGHIFTREPVLSPSTLVAQIVLKGQAGKLKKGVDYLSVLDPDFVQHQRCLVRGMDLERFYRSGTLLVDAARTLHGSMGWTERHFVQVLQELAVFYPDAANSLHLLESSFVLVQLLLYLRETMLRFVDLRRRLQSLCRGMELLNLMGRHHRFFLREADGPFWGCLQWLLEFERAGCDWTEALELCRIVHAGWRSSGLSLAECLERLGKLRAASPKVLLNGLKNHLGKSEEEWQNGWLPALLEKSDQVVKRLGEIKSEDVELSEELPVVLTYDVTVAQLCDNLCAVRKALSEIGIREVPAMAEALLRRPEIIQNPSPWIELSHHIWPLVQGALHQNELEMLFQERGHAYLTDTCLKLQSIIHCLSQDHGLETEEIKRRFQDKAARVRQWSQMGSLPKELGLLFDGLSSTKWAELLAMSEKEWEELEASLLVLFGPCPSHVFSSVHSMPELLDPELLQTAIVAARCTKLQRSELRSSTFRKADELFASLVQTLTLLKTRRDLSEAKVLTVLERLSEKELLTGDLPVASPTQLAQFCILCLEHPGAWEQFERLLARVDDPLLQQARPVEMQKMQKEVFHAILAAPEIFLIPYLWKAMVQWLKTTQWTFAGIDAEAVLSMEPCLFYFAVQKLWNHKFDRNARKLIEAPKPRSRVQRRGKSIVCKE